MSAYETTTQTRHEVLCGAMTLCCPLQVLVVDRPDGLADILLSTVARLLQPAVCVTRVPSVEKAGRVLESNEVDLVVLAQPGAPAVAQLRRAAGAARMMMVMDGRPRTALPAGVQAVRMPRQARELKELVTWLVREYLG